MCFRHGIVSQTLEFVYKNVNAYQVPSNDEQYLVQHDHRKYAH